MRIIFEICEKGNLHGLYTETIDLLALGMVTDVHKASNVEFCEEKQMWQILSLDGEILYENSHREEAIEEEIKIFSPGGKYYVRDQTIDCGRM